MYIVRRNRDIECNRCRKIWSAERWVRAGVYAKGYTSGRARSGREGLERPGALSARYLGSGSLVVELEEAAKNLVAGERVFPSVGREDGAVEGLMCIGQPGGKLVVEIGEGAVLNLGWVDAWRVEPCVAKANEFTGGVGDGFDTRGSSDSEGSWPGARETGRSQM
jgi:hypothetical protein